jgi:Uncharacterised nucleotidyltransferase
MSHASRPTDGLLAIARSLYVDVVTADVTKELRARGVRSILLKGPAVAGWLYRDGTPRPYADTDLLIAPSNLAAAKVVLEDLGFESVSACLGHPTGV